MKKGILIVILVVLIVLVIVLPIKDIIIEPSIIGALFARVYVRPAWANYSCSATFLEGWNLISTPCLASNTSVASVFSSISGDYVSIHGYDPDDDSDPWKSYNPSLQSWVVHDLTEINEKKGYWINMKNQDTFYLNGTLRDPNSISLVSGWNLIGYPANTTKGVADALSSIGENYTTIWLYNATDSTYYYYDALAGDGTLGQMRPYYGYWVNMSISVSLVITS